MSESADSKSKDKRLEEIEKLEAELERSVAVAKVKSAHKQIEDTEKSRKHSVVLSICKRLGLLLGYIQSVLRVFKYEYFHITVGQGVESVLEGIE